MQNQVGVEGVTEGIILLFVTRLLQLFHVSLMLGLSLLPTGAMVQMIFKLPCNPQSWPKVNGVQTPIMLD